ncbi:MAG: YfaZ family outer membrane protein [Pseudomonadota bacterium]
MLIRWAGLAASGLMCLVLVQPAVAGDLDLNLNDDAARLTYAWPARGDRLKLDAGWLHHQDRGDVIHGGLHLVDFASSGPNPVRGGLGGKLFYVDTETTFDDELVLGVGGFLKYTLPQYNRFSIGGSVYFAPDVLAFGDSDEFVELEARLSYNVLREGDIYLGARYINIGFDGGGDFTLDNGLHAGIQLRF